MLPSGQLILRYVDQIAVRFVLAPDQEDALAFASSPLLETVLSLHVLVEPRHHALQHDWVRAMRRLPPALRREIAALSFLYRYTLANCVLPSASGADDDFAAELRALRRLPTDVAAFELLRPIYDHGGKARSRRRLLADPEVRKIALGNARRQGRDPHRAAAQLLDDPPGFVERFARLLEDYWEAAFEQEWARIEPLLADAIVQAGRRIAGGGLYGFLAGLAPALRVEPAEHRFGLDIPHDHTVPLSAQSPLVLVPSVYVWPHVRVNCDGPWPLMLTYRAPHLAESLRPATQAELVRGLRAVADPTRVRILELVGARPRSTQELAPLVSLTEAGTSRHLRALAEAGLLTTRREGYYVVYSILEGALDRLADELRRCAGPRSILKEPGASPMTTGTRR
jgi:DNA-binding transcriptional ArsR family regulator